MYEPLSLFRQKKNWKYLEEYHCCLWSGFPTALSRRRLRNSV